MSMNPLPEKLSDYRRGYLQGKIDAYVFIKEYEISKSAIIKGSTERHIDSLIAINQTELEASKMTKNTDEICSVTECTALIRYRDLCGKHYKRWWRHGNPLTIQTGADLSLQQRFNRFVVQEADCWIWIGAKSAAGYGQLRVDNIAIYAHRLSWFLHHGYWPEPKSLVLHSCDTPACVNPDHLRLGTHADNNRDMHERGRGIRGELAHNARLTESGVMDIRRRLQRGETQAHIAHHYNVSPSTISSIRRSKTWKHVKEDINVITV